MEHRPTTRSPQKEVTPITLQICVVTSAIARYAAAVLTEKPWRTEAVLRLGIALFLCQFIGAVTLAATRFSPAHTSLRPWAFFVLVAASAISCCVALYMVRKPWNIERFTRQFILLIFFTYLGLTFGAFVQHFTKTASEQSFAIRAVLAALSFQGAALVLVPLFLREHQQTWDDAFGFSIKPGMAIVFGVLAACAFVPVGELIQRASFFVISQTPIKPEIQPAVEALTKSVSWLDRSALAITTILLAPVAEELLFRGIIYTAVKRAGFPKLALFGTSIFFALVHLNLVTFAPLIVLALVLTLLYEKTGNLLAPITAHAVFNLLNFVRFLVLESGLHSS